MTNCATPPRWLLLAELPRLAGVLVSLPLGAMRLARAPRGEPRPIMVIPGFGAGDASTAVLRGYLRWLGHDAQGWGLGINIGARTVGLHNEVLIRRLAASGTATGRKMTLIGWSMGGILARMIARARPDLVEEVIVLGAPFTGDPYANHGWRTYESISGHRLSHPVARRQIAASKLPLPVRSTSIYSRSDGVVNWRCCIEPPGPQARNIEVSTPHCGYGFAPRVLATIAAVLASPSSAT